MDIKDKKTLLGYTLVNEEKLDRAIHGSVTDKGQMNGGVGEDATDAVILAEYDRLAGLILKGQHKVQTGSFYNFKERRPRTEKEVKLLFRDLKGNEIAIPEDAEVPIELKAAQMAQEAEKSGVAKKRGRPKKVEKPERDDE